MLRMWRLVVMICVSLLAGCSGRMTPERVADRYITSLQSRDFEQFRSLFDSARAESITPEMFISLVVSDMKVLNIDPPYIDVAYSVAIGRDEFQEAGTIYLLPDLRIKYEPVFMPHLALALRGFLEQMRSSDPADLVSVESTLASWGLSDFGFDPAGTAESQDRAADRFEVWLNDAGPTFDLGETLIPLSPMDRQRL